MKEVVPLENIAALIYFVRGRKIMLDRDLAILYGVPTKRLKEQVRRNIERFPEDFMFELTREEFDSLRPQFATSNRGGTRYMPMAFTEHGVLMLSSVLKSEKAIQVNIQIVRAFTKLRENVLENGKLRQEIEALRDDTEGKFRIVFEALDQLLASESRQGKKIGFIP